MGYNMSYHIQTVLIRKTINFSISLLPCVWSIQAIHKIYNRIFWTIILLLLYRTLKCIISDFKNPLSNLSLFLSLYSSQHLVITIMQFHQLFFNIHEREHAEFNFCSCLISLNTMSSIHFVGNDRETFLCEFYLIVHRYHIFFTHSSVGEHLRWFHILAIMNSTDTT
jgi:hypothetical protein